MKNFFKKLSALALLGILLIPSVSFGQATVALPPQPGNAGKFLQTDGLNLSWQNAGGGGGGDCPNALNTEVIYSDGTDCQGDALFTRNVVTGGFAVSGAYGGGPFDLSSLYIGTYGGQIDGVFMNYQGNGGTNGNSVIFTGDATSGLGEPIAAGIISDNGATGDSSSIVVFPTLTGLNAEDASGNVGTLGVTATSISTLVQNALSSAEIFTNKNTITFGFDGAGPGKFYTFPQVDGTSGQQLTTNGSGALSWAAATSGVTSINTLTGAVTLAAGTGISLTPVGNTITIAASTPALTATQVAFGSGANLMTSSAGLTFTAATNCLRVDGIDICSPTTNTTVIGEGAGNIASITGTWNTLIGRQSGAVITNGTQNAFLGYQTGFANTTGASNTFLGNQAGVTNIDGGNNVFVGNTAGYLNSTGDFNVFVGDSAGYTSTADRNTAVGHAAGYAMATGGNNTFVGYAAGNSSNGQQNVMVGSSAGAVASGSGSTFVGYSAGIFDAGGDNTFIGWKSGEVNTTGFFNVFLGSVAGNDNVSGGRNLFAGYGAGQNGSADNDNVFLGYAAGEAADGVIQSVIIGSQANQVGASTGDNNVFIGYLAARDVTTAANSVIIGSQAGDALTAGIENTIIGKSAGSAITGAANITSANVFIGMNTSIARTQGTNNTIVGTKADGAASTGSSNTMLGYLAGGTSTSASENVMLGAAAGYNVTTASTNIFIGTAADSFFNGTGMIALGASAVTTASNQMVVGSSATPVSDYFFGEGVLSATPGTTTFNASGGTGTDIAGGDYILATGKATGNAIAGNYKVQTSVPGATGTTLQTLGDRQAILSKYTTLTESTATAFARVTIPTGTVAGGTVNVTVEANDATDFQSDSQVIAWTAVNKAGTLTIDYIMIDERTATSAGTFSCTPTVVDSGSGNLDFKTNCVSSLTQTVLRANAQVFKNFGTGVITAQ